MMETTEAPISAEQLEALWGGKPSWHVVPYFTDDPSGVPEAEAWLSAYLGTDPVFTHDARDAGVARLRRMARIDSRCANFVWVADLLENNAAHAMLVMGWVLT